MRNIFGILIPMVMACLCLVEPVTADDEAAKSAKEYQVKAAFIYNFVKFVEWPGDQALSKTHTANICIQGDNPFGSALSIFKQASTPQLAFNVERNIPDNALAGCHILFISRSEEVHAATLLAATRTAPVLTVSEMGNFIETGGVIEMVKSEQNIGLFSKDKINLRINLRAAEAKGLHIDAQLLEIAAEVIK